MEVRYVAEDVEIIGLFFGRNHDGIIGWYRNINYAIKLRHRDDFSKYKNELGNNYFYIKQIYKG